MTRLLALFPCKDEAISIGSVVTELKCLIQDADVVVINNGSSDETEEVAKLAGARVIREPRPGKGYAVTKGFSQLTDLHEVVFLCDGDSTYSISELKLAINLVLHEGYDLVVGRRTVANEEESRLAYRKGHRWGNSLFAWLFVFLFGYELKDTLSGWRVMSSSFVRSFTQVSRGFEIESQLNVHAFALGIAVKEIPVEYGSRHPDAKSKLRTFPDGMRILFSYLKLFFSERPLFAFCSFSLPIFSYSFFLFWNVANQFLASNSIPNFPSLIVGSALLILGILLVVTGLILENVRTVRKSLLRLAYSGKIR